MAFVYLLEVVVDFVEPTLEGILKLCEGDGGRVGFWQDMELVNVPEQRVYKEEESSHTCYDRLSGLLQLLNNLIDILDALVEVGIPPQLGQFDLEGVHGWS